MLAPVLAQVCRYESIIDGTLGLHDIALMNDALAVRADNEAEARRRAKREENG
ncbi:DUF6889 family protein [Herbaspirillum robiniae]|uniref:DUF6889 family protein n=1 Tax=Herbaspirillum robiniae TaxID=2014887 RepID=UPI001ED9C7F1|nr:hypothetical protein [Herbaspirillum robiniae]